MREKLPPENILFEPEDLLCYSYDATRERRMPDLVVIPRDEDDVIHIVKTAGDCNVPIIARGAGSGFVGAASPIHGGIIILFSKMNKIIEIDKENFTARVQPGIVTADLQKAVKAHGLFYPPDPASLKISSIGGNVAMGSGGPSAVKYGVTKDYVLGLRVVLPNGETLKTGIETLKGVVGYDITRLFTGSEGTLGVFTEILLKLIPHPETKKTITVSFNDLELTVKTVVEILQKKIVPSTMEFIDESALKAVGDFAKMDFTGVKGLLLIEVDGSEAEVQESLAKLREICSKDGVLKFKVAQSEAEREDLWRVRRSISPAVGKLKPTKINEDITVPRNQLPTLIRGVEKIAKKYDLLIVNFGHAGDGNIHVNIMTDKQNKEEYARALEAVNEVFDLTLALKGTISGEHGVGLAKQPYVAKELSPDEISWMKKIKQLFDPQNIMNPGKMFPE